jgi:(1->4)-alpha-D-glucan 1-alpha-D-glucosylmutase
VLADQSLCDRIGAFAARLGPYARANTLGRKLLQLTMPGVPDLYQGSELEVLTLVDPDNRSPVDYGVRAELLRRLDAGAAPEHLDAEKLLVVARTLRLRRDQAAAFAPGAGYEPLPARGPAASHVVGFSRGGTVTALATRLPVGLERAGGWRDTTVDLTPQGTWTDVLTGRRLDTAGPVAVADLLDRLPVALLVR